MRVGDAQFSSTLHNVTAYCFGTIGLDDCSHDFSLRRWDLEFVGQNNTVTKYYYQNTTARNTDSLSSVKSFSYTTDFAQSLFNITFQDTIKHTIISESQKTFVGTSNSFEIDWADYNNDGVVNGTDTSAAQAAFGSSDSYWDFNRDGTVDVSDVARVAYHYRQSFGIANFPSQGRPIKTLDPQWKNSCSVFLDPAKGYCNSF